MTKREGERLLQQVAIGLAVGLLVNWLTAPVPVVVKVDPKRLK